MFYTLRHILPNAIFTLVVIAALASAIRTEASLSFLSSGVPLPTLSWGNILSEGRQYINAICGMRLMLDWRSCWRC